MKASFQKNLLDECKMIVGMLEAHGFYLVKNGNVWDGMIWNYFGIIWHTHLLPSFGNYMRVKEDLVCFFCHLWTRSSYRCNYLWWFLSLRNFATTEVSLLLDIQTGSWEARLLIAKCDPLLMGSIQGVMLPGLLDYCQPEWEYVYIKIHVRPNGGKVVCDINYLINHQNHQVNHSQSMVLILHKPCLVGSSHWRVMKHDHQTSRPIRRSEPSSWCRFWQTWVLPSSRLVRLSFGGAPQPEKPRTGQKFTTKIGWYHNIWILELQA